MTAALRPLPGVRPGALVAPQLDPRPCVSRPARWWDTGDEHNAIAIRLCRNVCPLRDACAPLGEGSPKDQIIAGLAYNHAGKQIAICRRCDRPRIRSTARGVSRCGCPTRSKRARTRTETEQREDYLYEINRCEHRSEWRQAGGMCGGCGRDNFAEMEEAA